MRRRIYEIGETKTVTKFLFLPVKARTGRGSNSPEEWRWLETATVRYVLNAENKWEACNFEAGLLATLNALTEASRREDQ